MQADTLVRMANQIGEFFAAMPDRAEALLGLAEHLRKFWDPRMRRELLAHLDSGAAGAGSSNLSPMVVEALAMHRDVWIPAPAVIIAAPPAVNSPNSPPAVAPGPAPHQ
jgi:formate dehydrogenase subunit delta